MISVKLYGLLRIDSGIREKTLEASEMKDVFSALAQCGIPEKKLSGCVIFINGRNGNRKSKLKDGDQVVLMPPVAGG